MVVFISIFLFNCGGGDSSPAVYIPPQHAPSISNLYFYPASATVGQGSGAVTIYFDFDFFDQDANLKSLTINYSDTLGNSGTIPGDLSLLHGMTSGVCYATVVGDTSQARTVYFEFYVTDGTGLKSNKLYGSWIVS